MTSAQGFDYEAFIESKRIRSEPSGFDVEFADLCPKLFPFQSAIVRWAIRRGRAAIFADCGLGKTPIQLEWAQHVSDRTEMPVLILAPLAVAQQTRLEGEKFGVVVNVCKGQADMGPGINITNYEKLHHFLPDGLAGIVLDESSILKAYDGKTKKQLQEFARDIPYRLCATATPAPNDLTEICNHAEFLSIMQEKEIKALFFTQDGNTATKWRLKGHAQDEFWKWMASWAVACRMPADIGFENDGFELPPLRMHQVTLRSDKPMAGFILSLEAHTLEERRTAKRDSIGDRVRGVEQLIRDSWISSKRANTTGSTESPTGTRSSSAENSGTKPTSSESEKEHVNTQQQTPTQSSAKHPKCATELPTEIDSVHTCESDTNTSARRASLTTKRGVRVRSGDGKSGTGTCADTSASRLTNTSECSASKMVDAPSVELASQPMEQNSPLTTAIQQASSVASSACRATTELGDSETIQQNCAAQPSTSKTQWVVWCTLNAEQDAIADLLGDDCVSIYGSLDAEEKLHRYERFARGDVAVLVTKSSIFGHGVNMQFSNHAAFVGMDDSFESYYQTIRRQWRFGQKREVYVHIFSSSAEGAIVSNIQRKETQAREMFESIVREMGKNMDLKESAKVEEMAYREDLAEGKQWKLYLGDSVKVLDKIESESVGLSVFSPPFPGMYTYTNSPHDIGNTRNLEEMVEHFRFIVAKEKLFRVLMPGRSCCIHLTQAVAKKGVDGYIGLKDFRGKVIQLMEEVGWVYYGEVCIDKDPQVKAIRTKDQGLLFKTLAHDSSKMHMALADYVLQFRKPGDNPVPIASGLSKRYGNTTGWITDEEWIEWAAPVWYRKSAHYPGGIYETDVLNVRQARETNDERHLCPLQLGVIERCVKLWSAPGETVLSPFAGIGSEGYKAVLLGRKFIGVELKESYWKQAVINLKVAEHESNNDICILQAFKGDGAA